MCKVARLSEIMSTVPEIRLYVRETGAVAMYSMRWDDM